MVVIADYPTRAWLRVTEAVSVLLETYQCGTNAPLQSVFACVLLRSTRQCLQLGRIQP